MDTVNKAAQHRPPAKRKPREMYLEAAAVLKPMAEQYTRVSARCVEGEEKVQITMPIVLLRRMYLAWEKLIDEGGLE